eukprot:322502_1
MFRRFCKFGVRKCSQRLRCNINYSRYERSWKEYTTLYPVVLALPVPAIIRVMDYNGQNLVRVDIFSVQFLIAAICVGAGIYQYRELQQHQHDNLKNKLSKSQASISEYQQKLTMSETEISVLKKKNNQLKSLQNTLKQHQSNTKNLLKQQKLKNEELLTKFNDKIESVENKLKTQRTQNRKLSDEVQSLNDDLTERDKKNQQLLTLQGELKTRINHGRKENYKIQTENDKLTENVLHEKQQSAALSVKLKSLENAYKNEVQSLKDDLTERDKKNQQLLTLQGELKTRINHERKENYKIQTENDKLTENVLHEKQQSGALSVKLKSLENAYKNEVQSLKDDLTKGDKKNQQLKTRINHERKNNSEKKTENDKLTENLLDEQQQSEFLSMQLKWMENDLENLSTEKEQLTVNLDQVRNESNVYKTKLQKMCESKRFTFEAVTGSAKIEDNGRTIKVLSNGYGSAKSCETYDAGVHVFEIRWTGQVMCGAVCQIGICTDDVTHKYCCEYTWDDHHSYMQYEGNEICNRNGWWKSGDNIYIILDLNKKQISYFIQGKPYKISNIIPGSYRVYFTCHKSNADVKFEILG